jgi:hypothetical protein
LHLLLNLHHNRVNLEIGHDHYEGAGSHYPSHVEKPIALQEIYACRKEHIDGKDTRPRKKRTLLLSQFIKN